MRLYPFFQMLDLERKSLGGIFWLFKIPLYVGLRKPRSLERSRWTSGFGENSGITFIYDVMYVGREGRKEGFLRVMRCKASTSDIPS